MGSIVNSLIPMANVADVQRSINFYQSLGFTLHSEWKNEDGTLQWAHVKSGNAHIMFARAQKPIDRKTQAMLFYMYSPNLTGLREQLIARGITVPAITYPFYMEKGEMQLEDPDGYCVLIGQIG